MAKSKNRFFPHKMYLIYTALQLNHYTIILNNFYILALCLYRLALLATISAGFSV